jgi:hypothetical protein
MVLSYEQDAQLTGALEAVGFAAALDFAEVVCWQFEAVAALESVPKDVACCPKPEDVGRRWLEIRWQNAFDAIDRAVAIRQELARYNAISQKKRGRQTRAVVNY